MKSWLRDFLANGLQSLGITNPSLRYSDHLFIVTFHRVLPEEQRQSYPLPGLVVTPEELDWFVRFFQEHFRCLRLDSLSHDMSKGRLPEQPGLAITFDDGQLDNFLHAAPVLDRYGIPATFFVPVDAVQHQELLWHDRMGYAIQGLISQHPQSQLLTQFNLYNGLPIQNPALAVSCAKQWTQSQRDKWIRQAEELVPESIPSWDGMMTWEHLRELVHRGHEIGSHSYSHPLLVQCDDTQLEHEIIGSRLRLEKELGTEVSSFCYPNGDLNERVLDVVSRAGYSLAVTTQWGSNLPGNGTLALKRIDMVAENSRNRHGALSAARVAMRMTGFVRGVQ